MPSLDIPLRSSRSIITWLYVAMAIASLWGPEVALSIVPLFATLTLFSMAARLAGRTVSLQLFWEAGFLLLVVGEILVFSDLLIREFSAEVLGRSSMLFMIGHSCVIATADSLARRQHERITRGRLNLRLPVVLLISIIAYSYSLPAAFLSLSSGRGAALDYAADSGALGGILQGAALATPGLTAMYLKHVRGSSLWVSYAVLSPLFAAQFVTGTRYALLISVASPLFVYLGTRLYNFRQVALLPVTGSLLVAASNAMLALRRGDERSGGLFSLTDFLGREGVVRTTCQLILHFDEVQHLQGRSLGSIIVSPVPRSLWSEKPTLIGHWFPREFGLSGFSDIHSVSLGYIGDGYADFGLIGVTLYAVGLGVLLGMTNRAAQQTLNRQDGSFLGIFLSASLPAAFFAVRSPVTTLVVLFGVGLWVSLAKALSSFGDQSGDAAVPVLGGDDGLKSGRFRGATGRRGESGKARSVRGCADRVPAVGPRLRRSSWRDGDHVTGHIRD